jgi:CBS-domain-containing membrane protein
MATATGSKTTPLVLEAATALDLMIPNPAGVRATATVAETVALLTDRGVSAAPVLNEAGRPVGVVTRADIIIHARQKVQTAPPSAVGDPSADPARVADVMTPAVFSVTPETPAHKVIEELAAMKVHQLFVVDSGGALVGVINALDVISCLHR